MIGLKAVLPAGYEPRPMYLTIQRVTRPSSRK